MNHRTLFNSIVSSAAVLVIGVGVSVAHAQPAPLPSAVPTITTLPLFGVQLTVDVAMGPGGALTSVAVNPADGLTATAIKPNRVVFANEDGTAKVVVAGSDGRQGVQVRAGSLADITGDGAWSGDVFGTGVATTVSFTVGATADGGPDITDVSSSDATALISETDYTDDGDQSNGHHGDNGDNGDHGDDSRSASVKVTFTSGAQSRSLGIRASLSIDDDGAARAKVSVGIGTLRGVAQPLADAIGAKLWTGLLCDGTTAAINYTVNADGSITVVTASPDAERIRAKGNSGEVRFSESERVRLYTRSNDDGMAVQVDERIRCEDSPDPTVNTPIGTSTTTVAGDDDDPQHDSTDDDSTDDNDSTANTSDDNDDTNDESTDSTDIGDGQDDDGQNDSQNDGGSHGDGGDHDGQDDGRRG